MNRNRNAKSQQKRNFKNKGGRKSQRAEITKKYDGDEAKLEAKGRNNNPNWYFTNEELARQGSYLSFQQIAG